MFERVVANCIAAGLVGGEAFSIDASLIKADAARRGGCQVTRPSLGPSPRRRRARFASTSRRSRAAMTKRPALKTAVERWRLNNSQATETGLADGSTGGMGGEDGHDPFFAYDANYLVDNKLGIIVDAEGTRANRIAETAITGTMIARAKDRFGLGPAVRR